MMNNPVFAIGFFITGCVFLFTGLAIIAYRDRKAEAADRKFWEDRRAERQAKDEAVRDQARRAFYQAERQRERAIRSHRERRPFEKRMVAARCSVLAADLDQSAQQ